MGEDVDPTYHGRRDKRVEVNVPARTVGAQGEHQGVVQDISASGAAIASEEANYSNDQFVELHMEGYEKRAGRVVREFSGGYALKFELDEKLARKMAEEIEKFRNIAGKQNYLKG